MAAPTDPRWLPVEGSSLSVPPAERQWKSGPEMGSAIRSVSKRAPVPPLLQVVEEETPVDLADATIAAAPSWLVSSILHMAILLLLALFLLPPPPDRLELNLRFSRSLGNQLEVPTAQVGTDEPELQDPSENEPETPVESPESEPVEAEPTETVPHDATSQLQVTTIDRALSGREPGQKEELLATYGGSRYTDQAVLSALDWLKKQQHPNGSWSLVGSYRNGARSENKLAATAMALLAFQGDGNTHQRGDFQRQVNAGKKALLAMQSPNGNFWEKGLPRPGDDRLYSQAQATIALCELFAMSGDESLREPAQRAIDYAIAIQDSLGGWRYYPGDGSDTSVTGWFVMALQSGLMGGLDVPAATLEQVTGYLDLAADDGSAGYGYRPGTGADPVMTAEALLCRQYLGWRREDPRLRAGIEYLTLHPIDWNDQNVYYWYYATQVMHHVGGPEWREWNSLLRSTVPAHQEQEGAEAGSWAPQNDAWGPHGGRLYTTCMCVYMLEVYYRHLPIYDLQ